MSQPLSQAHVDARSHIYAQCSTGACGSQSTCRLPRERELQPPPGKACKCSAAAEVRPVMSPPPLHSTWQVRSLQLAGLIPFHLRLHAPLFDLLEVVLACIGGEALAHSLLHAPTGAYAPCCRTLLEQQDMPIPACYLYTKYQELDRVQAC